MKKIVSIILTLCIVSINSVCPLAAPEVSAPYRVLSTTYSENQSSNVIRFDTGELCTINISQEDETFTVSFSSMSTSEQGFFKVNLEDRTLYSSITGKTIPLYEEGNDNNINGPLRAQATPGGGGSSHFPLEKVIKISDKTIHDAIGGALTNASIISLILSYSAAALPTAAVLGTVALVTSFVTSGATLIFNKIKQGSPNHGFKITMKRVTGTKKQGGKTYTFYKYRGIKNVKA